MTDPQEIDRLRAENERLREIVRGSRGDAMNGGIEYADFMAEAAISAALKQAREEEREACAAFMEKEAEDIARAGDQFDKGGDIYRKAGLVRGPATAIRNRGGE